MNPSAALLKATFNGISEIYAEDRITCPECHSRQNEHIKWGFYYRYWPGTYELVPIQRYFRKRESCPRKTFSVLPHPFLPYIRFTLCSLLILIQLADAGETISEIAEILRVRRSTARRVIRFARKFSDWMDRESKTAPWMPSPCLNPGRFWPLFTRMISWAFFPDGYRRKAANIL